MAVRMSVMASARAALRGAISEREAAKVRLLHAKQAEPRGHDLHFARKQELAFADVDLAIVQFRAEAVNGAATGARSSDSGLPGDLVTRRAIRDQARDRFTAAKGAHEGLVADLVQAESAAREAGAKVVVAAIDVLIAEGVEQASALTGALNDVLQRYDRLRALVDCRLHYAESSHPIKLPTDIVTILQTVAALDGRQFPGGRNHAAAHTGELWSRWFEALLVDADAKVTFEQSPTLNTGGTADATLPMAHVAA